jgi:MFS family permease
MTEEPPQGSVLAPPAAAVDEGRLDPAAKGRLVVVLAIIVLLSEIVPFVYSLAGVITPLVGKSFPIAGNSVTWMITIVGVIGGATIALICKMADLWGKKRMMLAASVVFVAGTLVCALTSAWWLFLVGRGLEAVAIGMSALCYSLVRDIMPRSWVPISIGFVGTGIGVSAVAAPLIGGLLTNHFSWRSIFWFMVIYMAVVVPLFAVLVPESKVRQRQRLDVVGALLIGGSLAAILLYLSQGQSWGWTSPGCYPYLIGGLLALGLFIFRERTTSSPIIDLKLLRAPRLSMLLAIGFFVTALNQALGFMPAFMFLVGERSLKQQILALAVHRTHLPASLLAKFISFRGDIGYAAGFSLFQLAWHVLLWMAVTGMIFGPVGAIWARRSGARLPLIAGMVALVAATAGLAAWHQSWLPVALFGALAGVAFGLYFGTVPNMLVDAVPRGQQAISAGMLAAFGSVGGAFATATVTSILVRYPFQVIATEPTGKKLVNNIPQVYTSTGYGHAYLFVGVIAAIVALGLALVLRIGRTPAQGGALE